MWGQPSRLSSADTTYEMGKVISNRMHGKDFEGRCKIIPKNTGARPGTAPWRAPSLSIHSSQSIALAVPPRLLLLAAMN